MITGFDVRAGFPFDVVARVSEIDPSVGSAFVEEREMMRRAVPSRVAEFFTSRALARDALAEWGQPAVAIGVGGHREPLWPNGFFGSITHSAGRCAVVVARRSVGLDIEGEDSDLSVEHDLLLAGGERSVSLLATFSVKEAVFKACFPIDGQWREFNEVRLDRGSENRDPDDRESLDGESDEYRIGWSATHLPGELRARTRRVGGYLLSTAWLRHGNG